jgi:hypothetical protein
MKRAFLIAGGTVGGLGAVLAITPPQINQTTEVAGLTGAPVSATTDAVAPASTPSSTPTPAATKAATKAVATKSAQVAAKPTASATAEPSKSAASTPTPTPSATKTTAAPSSGGYSGTVTGASYAARNFGTLSATVTFANGKITNVSASQSPSSWSQQSLSALIPFVNSGKITIEQVKQYSAVQLPCSTGNSCNSRASFTAEAFWLSIKSAISKAGL